MTNTTTTLYGIPNCDTIRKAKRWLNDRDIAFTFHDYRKDGIDEKQLKVWADILGWKAMLNTRGTTWRKLPEETREGVDEEKAIQIMAEHPAVIKRPILCVGDGVYVGFSEEVYGEIF